MTVNPLPRAKNTVKWNSERRIPRKSSENQRLSTRANLVVQFVVNNSLGTDDDLDGITLDPASLLCPSKRCGKGEPGELAT